jgi:signal peptidase I
LKHNGEVFSYQIKKERRRRTGFVILFFICLYIFINLVITFLVYPVRQNSVSMIPDVPEKSVVMVSPVAGNYERGDVILLDSRYSRKKNFFISQLDRLVRFFTAQQISLFEHNEVPSSKSHIRRVVGMPGDTIYMRDYVLYIKPAGERHFLTEFEIVEDPYNVTFYVPPADWDTEIGVKGSFDEITLGYNEYFVLADNRKSSDDSRLWGAVKKDEITAKVIMCYFPFRNFKLL